MNLESEEFEDILEEMHEYVYETINDHLIQFSSKNFQENIIDACTWYFLSIGLIQEWCIEDDEEEIENVIEFIYNTVVYDVLNIPKRQVFTPVKMICNQPETIASILNVVNSYPVQKQRSPEWYDLRKKCFSASNLWKLFGSPSQYNSLIYEKCKPIDIYKQEYNGVTNLNTPLNWGIKYEPVSVMIYEDMYNTTVNTNYGCIPHSSLPIGASPDGIVNDPESSQYGHMVEIKNIFNRDITGIPSEDYWIQMQIQLETTGLTYCDFLETRFKEYPNGEAYYEDTAQKYKGIILYFIPLDGVADVESKFVYKPLRSEEQTWIDAEITQHETTHVLYETMYWYLDEVSCVLIERNSVWFSKTIPVITEAWQIVQKERIEGFEHRAPQKRKPKFEESIIPSSSLELLEKGSGSEHGVKNIQVVPVAVCLIKLDENGNVIKA